MRTKILSLFAAVGLMASFSACDDHNYGTELESRGTLSFSNFGLSVDESHAVVESSRAASTKPEVSNFLVTIINKATGKPVTGYTNGKKFSELPGVVDLPVGAYTVKVESHKPLKADWNAPYYVGSKDIDIVEDQITNAESILCKFNSVRVSIKYSEKLTPLLGDDVQVTISYGDGAYLNFNKSETRSGYFAPVKDATTMIARIIGTINGQKVEENRSFGNIEPGKHYVITFKVLGPQDAAGETGMINPGDGVTIDTSVVSTDRDGNVTIEEETLNGDDRPGKEDPDPDDPKKPDDPTPPTVDDEFFNIEFLNRDFNETYDAIDGEQYQVIIKSKNPIEDLTVTVHSETLTPEELEDVGLAESFSLADPGEFAAGVNSLGLPSGDLVKGQAEVTFDISSFMSLLNILGPGYHEFILTVVDNEHNQVERTVKLRTI